MTPETRGWDYEFDDTTLTIRVGVQFTMDLLPAILRDIFHAMFLGNVERVRMIEIERTYPYSY